MSSSAAPHDVEISAPGRGGLRRLLRYLESRRALVGGFGRVRRRFGRRRFWCHRASNRALVDGSPPRPVNRGAVGVIRRWCHLGCRGVIWVVMPCARGRLWPRESANRRRSLCHRVSRRARLSMALPVAVDRRRSLCHRASRRALVDGFCRAIRRICGALCIIERRAARGRAERSRSRRLLFNLASRRAPTERGAPGLAKAARCRHYHSAVLVYLFRRDESWHLLCHLASRRALVERSAPGLAKAARHRHCCSAAPRRRIIPTRRTSAPGDYPDAAPRLLAKDTRRGLVCARCIQRRPI